MTLPYGHTNLLVAALLLSEAAVVIEAPEPSELELRVCELLVQKAKEQLGGPPPS